MPDLPPATALPTCETAGVLGAAVAWVAALQVVEALKILLGARPEEHRLHAVDVWRGTSSAADAAKRPDCPCCGEERFEFLDGARGSSSMALCGRNAVQVMPDCAVAPSFEHLVARLERFGRVEVRGMILEFAADGRRLVVFPDGRALVFGTVDPGEARSFVAKYLGM